MRFPPPQKPLTRQRTTDSHLTALGQSCVQALSALLPSTSSTLSAPDSRLAATLTDLLETCYDLESLGSSMSSQIPAVTEPSAEDAFTGVVRHINEMQSRQLLVDLESLQPEVNEARRAIVWERLESLGRVVEVLIKARERSINGTNPLTDPALSAPEPPRYSSDFHFASDPASLPNYQKEDLMSTRSIPLDEKTAQPAAQPEEKMLLELDSLTTAIERLHTVTPQMQDQRVAAPAPRDAESRSMARAKMERGRMKELEMIWDNIERAHGKRRMGEDDQRVDTASLRERRTGQVGLFRRSDADGKREKFLQGLFDQAEASRLRGQDSPMGNGVVNGDLARARDLRDVSC